MTKKGITPVVAIVLLLLLTIAAAGAAFAFSQNLVGQKIEEGEQRANSELSIKDIACPTGSPADATVDAVNTGDVNLEDADAYLYWVSNGSLIDQVSNTGNMWNATGDTFDSHTFSFSGANFNSGVPYKVELEFDNGYTTSGQCEP